MGIRVEPPLPGARHNLLQSGFYKTGRIIGAAPRGVPGANGVVGAPGPNGVSGGSVPSSLGVLGPLTFFLFWGFLVWLSFLLGCVKVD